MQEAERLVIQCRATSELPHLPNGDSLRTGRQSLEHRQLIGIVERFIEHTMDREHFTDQCLRHLKNIFANSSTGTNGRRSWIADLPQGVKTALIIANNFIQRHR